MELEWKRKNEIKCSILLLSIMYYCVPLVVLLQLQVLQVLLVVLVVVLRNAAAATEKIACYHGMVASKLLWKKL